MRRSLIVTIIVSVLAAGAVPALAGWEEGVAAFQKRDFDTAAAEFA